MGVCTHCGRASQGYERFCMSCGQPLDNNASAAAPLSAAGGSAGAPLWPRAGAESSPAAAEPEVQAGPAEAGSARNETAVATAPRSRLIVYRLASADGGSEDGPSIEVGEFILDGRDIAIGRAPSCDIVLEGDQLASRRHALLRSRSDGYTVVDLGSSNGTYINDLEIREAVLLHEGDHITIGGHEIVYSTSPASPHASLAGVKLTESEAAPMVDTDPNAVAMSARETAVSPAVGEVVVASGAVASSLEDLDLEDESPPDGVATGGDLEPDFASSSITDADFEALRVQLAEVSEALARKATAETRVIKQLRSALASARDQMAALVAQSSQTAEADSSTDVADLVTIARQAAENPRHLDYLTALAEHADEIADRLQNTPANTSGIPVSVVEALRARLDEALG